VTPAEVVGDTLCLSATNREQAVILSFGEAIQLPDMASQWSRSLDFNMRQT